MWGLGCEDFRSVGYEIDACPEFVKHDYSGLRRSHFRPYTKCSGPDQYILDPSIKTAKSGSRKPM